MREERKKEVKRLDKAEKNIKSFEPFNKMNVPITPDTMHGAIEATIMVIGRVRWKEGYFSNVIATVVHYVSEQEKYGEDPVVGSKQIASMVPFKMDANCSPKMEIENIEPVWDNEIEEQIIVYAFGQ